MSEQIQAVALFSGGLDSVLAARLVMEQGIRVRCLHFFSPFFGKPKALGFWRKVYGLDVEAVNIGDEYVRMLVSRPDHGFGSAINPCVDCKILMMRRALERMRELGASFLISGEVLGQRPMSQRRDSLNIISRDGNVRHILLRPLSAKLFDPTEPEISGLVNRKALESLTGRNRKGQLELAARLGITEIPAPAGGCKLTEKENACRYWPILTRIPNPCAADFDLAHSGRQGWSDHIWLTVGRNAADNDALPTLMRPDDVLLKVLDYPGPLALARFVSSDVHAAERELPHAAAMVASCAPKAVSAGCALSVRLIQNGVSRVIEVMPEKSAYFSLPQFSDIHDPIHEKKRSESEVA